MTTTEIVYKFNAPRMIHETIEKETVVIDTESGVYFSITGCGYLMVQALDQGADVSMLTAHLAAAYGLAPDTLRPTVEAFVATLAAEALIVPVAVGKPVAAGTLVVADEPFAPPVLEKFTDMHDLLLMDPIHEVSDAGWPHRR